MQGNEEIKDFFTKQIEQYGEKSPMAFDWGSRESQLTRFKVLSEIGDLNNKTILDIGCGFADFYSYLTWISKIRIADYVGIDLISKMIQIAGERHLESYMDLDLRVCDVMDQDLPQCDFVFGSGIHYLKSGEVGYRMRKVVTRMFELCRIGVATNMLSSLHNGARSEHSLRFDPIDTFRFCRTLTKFVTMRHDYLENDFTIYLYKERQ